MITNKEMFCVIFGAVASQRMPFKTTKAILNQARKEFGLTEKEASSLLSEMDNTLAFIISRLKDKAFKTPKDGFGI